jgi:hypothetical protein
MSKWLTIAAAILLTGCVTTTPSGDAGCVSYGIQRPLMPRDVPLPEGPWAQWVADLDDRMTGTCR